MFLFCLLFSLLPTEAFMLEDIHNHDLTPFLKYFKFKLFQIQYEKNLVIQNFKIGNIRFFDRYPRFPMKILSFLFEMLGFLFGILGVSKICDNHILYLVESS